MKNKTLIADLGLVYTAAVWGSTFFITKNSLSGISPLNLVAYRFLISAFIMLIILILMKKNPLANLKQGFLFGLLIFFMYVPQTIGLKYTSSSNSAFITGLFVVFVPLCSLLLFKKVPGPLKTLSIILALSGLWILTGGLKEINLGDIITLLSAFACGLHIIAGDQFMKKDSDPYIINFQQFFFVGITSLIISYFSGSNLSVGSHGILMTLIFLAVFPTVSAYIIQLNAQKFTDPLKVAVIFSLEPVFGAVFSWTLGGESFILNQVSGGSLIVLAMILSELKFNRKKLKLKIET